jgi:hypothetical protein
MGILSIHSVSADEEKARKRSAFLNVTSFIIPSLFRSLFHIEMSASSVEL